MYTHAHTRMLQRIHTYLAYLPTYGINYPQFMWIYANVPHVQLKILCSNVCATYYSSTGESVTCMCTHSIIDWPHWVFSTGVINIIMYVRIFLHHKYVSIINVHMYVLEQWKGYVLVFISELDCLVRCDWVLVGLPKALFDL